MKQCLRFFAFLCLWLGLTAWLARYQYLPKDHGINIVDSYENVLNGFYLSHGFTAYRDFASNHFPGVFQYLSWFNSIMGIGSIGPSVELIPRVIGVARFATIVFQLAAFAFALSLIRIPFVLSLPLGGMVVYAAHRHWLTAMPMTESFHFFLFISWPLLLYYAIFSADEKFRLRCAFLLGVPHAFVSAWVGLTTAPTSLFGSFVAVAIAWNLRAEWRSWVAKDRWIILVAVVGVTGSLASTIYQADVGKLIFYNFPFNKTLSINPVISLLDTLIHPLQFSEDLKMTLRPFAYGVILALLVARDRYVYQAEKPKSRGDRMLFFVGMFAGLWLVHWRSEVGIKTIASTGISMGLALLLLRRLIAPLPSWKKSLSLAAWVAFASASFVGGIWAGTDFFSSIYPLQNWTNRNAALDAARICHFGEKSDSCRCLRHTNWDPVFFFAWDVQQCPNWGIYMWLVNLDKTTRAKLDSDTRDDGVAFVVPVGITEGGEYRFPWDQAQHLLASNACTLLEPGGSQLICPGHKQ